VRGESEWASTETGAIGEENKAGMESAGISKRRKRERYEKTHQLNSLVSLIKLLHRIKHVTLPNVPLDERRVNLDTLLGVLQTFGEGEELRVRLGAVGVPAGVGGVALDRFGVVLDGGGEVTGLRGGRRRGNCSATRGGK
jgi:hypothetical protein